MDNTKSASPQEYYQLLDKTISQMENDGLKAQQMYHRLIQMGFREKDVVKKLKIGVFKFELLAEKLVTAQEELDTWVKNKKWDSYVFSNQGIDFDTLKQCQEFFGMAKKTDAIVGSLNGVFMKSIGAYSGPEGSYAVLKSDNNTYFIAVASKKLITDIAKILQETVVSLMDIRNGIVDSLLEWAMSMEEA